MVTEVVLTAVIAGQTAAIIKMGYDRTYGCLTRASFDMLYPILKLAGYKFIAGDVDNFKSHNSTHGHEAVNAMVKNSIRRFFSRRGLGDLVFRVYSGDEFIVATRGNVHIVAERLVKAFSAQGMNLTTDVITDNLDTSMVKILAKKKAS